MEHERLFWFYFIAINIVSAIIFWTDKCAAIKNKERIPERTLHLIEILGGVFAIIILTYLIHHKNRKFSFYILTWLILIGWISVLVMWYR